MLLLGQYRQKFYPPFEKFLGEGLVVCIGHQQKTIPALRSEEQVPVLGVPPGVGRCRQHTPPTLYLFLFPLISERSELIEVREQRAHSSSLRAVKTLTVCRGYCSLLGNLSPVGRKLPYHVLYWFAEGVARRGSVWYSVEQVWCRALLHDLFYVMQGVWNTFSLFWQIKGHTLIQC